MRASPQAHWASIPLPQAPIGLGHFGVVFLSITGRAVPPRVHLLSRTCTITMVSAEPRRGRFRAKARLAEVCSRAARELGSRARCMGKMHGHAEHLGRGRAACARPGDPVLPTRAVAMVKGAPSTLVLWGEVGSWP